MIDLDILIYSELFLAHLAVSFWYLFQGREKNVTFKRGIV